MHLKVIYSVFLYCPLDHWLEVKEGKQTTFQTLAPPVRHVSSEEGGGNGFRVEVAQCIIFASYQLPVREFDFLDSMALAKFILLDEV